MYNNLLSIHFTYFRSEHFVEHANFIVLQALAIQIPADGRLAPNLTKISICQGFCLESHPHAGGQILEEHLVILQSAHAVWELGHEPYLHTPFFNTEHHLPFFSWKTRQCCNLLHLSYCVYTGRGLASYEICLTSFPLLLCSWRQ